MKTLGSKTSAQKPAAQKPAWNKYEEVAGALLSKIKHRLGIERVEGKQDVPGASGTSWEIDLAGYTDTNGRVLVECRRYTKQGVTQDQMAGLAWRIEDTGSESGILVSPLEPQSGAKHVAAAGKIVCVTISADSTPTEYLMKFMDEIFVGFQDKVPVSATDTLRIVQRDRDGNVLNDETL